MNPVPVITVEVPPAIGPLVTERLVTVGIALYVNWSPATIALVPPVVVTLTSTAPAAWAGEEAMVSWVGELYVTTAEVAPKATVDAAVNPVPVITVEVPPAIGPLVTERLVTVGIGLYIYAPVPVTVPLVVVMTTFAAPAEPAGATAVREVPSTATTTLVAAVPPIVTVAPCMWVPTIVTEVPAASGPDVGVMLVNVGAGVVINVNAVAAEVALGPIVAVVTVISTAPVA